MAVITTEYMFLSLVLISITVIVIGFINNMNNTMYNQREVDILLSKFRNTLLYIPFVPDGSEYIITNPNQLPLTIYQGETPDGKYFVQISSSHGDYTNDVKIYNIKIDNLAVGQIYSTQNSFIRILKVRNEFVGNFSLTHIIIGWYSL